ncbi:hypothetical protein LJR039_004341 [Pseudorhodoferax sp. LjRoot39]|uniref:hypothetical protein n=1 Tax=Pseudorhodoferax sp. LjRoot39 TaxID=3342328 RepID=UPI003ECFF2CF
MKRPSFQFYPADWTTDLALRRCSPAARGVWMDVLCALHNSDDQYGLLRWPLKEIASTIGAPMAAMRELVEKGVLKGSDKRIDEALVYVPRHGRKDGEPVILIDTQAGPLWYSKRLVKDEYIRTIRGESSRFVAADGEASKATPRAAPKPPFGDGTTSSSSSSSSGNSEANASAGKPALEPAEIIFGYGLPLLTNAGTPEKQARSFLGALRKRPGGDAAVVNAIRDCLREKPLQPLEWLAAALPPASVEARPKAEPVSFAEQERRAGWARWEEMSGERHPELEKLRNTGDVIDVLPTNTAPRIAHVAA